MVAAAVMVVKADACDMYGGNNAAAVTAMAVIAASVVLWPA